MKTELTRSELEVQRAGVNVSACTGKKSGTGSSLPVPTQKARQTAYRAPERISGSTVVRKREHDYGMGNKFTVQLHHNGDVTVELRGKVHETPHKGVKGFEIVINKLFSL